MEDCRDEVPSLRLEKMQGIILWRCRTGCKELHKEVSLKTVIYLAGHIHNKHGNSKCPEGHFVIIIIK